MKRLVAIALLGFFAVLGDAQPGQAQWEYDYTDCEAEILGPNESRCQSLAQTAYNHCVATTPGPCQDAYNHAYDVCVAEYHSCMDCQRGGAAVWVGECETTCVTSEYCSIGYTTDMSNCNESVTDSCGCCQTYSPIVLPLGDGVPRLSSAENGVLFSLKPGTVRRVAWPRRNTAWLALDRNGNGVIDDGSELFGNTTPLSSGGFADNGYEPLAEFDLDHDGKIDAADPVFTDLRLWRDRRRDGVSESDELLSLESAGIVSISVRPSASERQDQWGNHYRYRARVQCSSRPTRRLSFDVFPVTLPVTLEP